jgi:hypothetical protein
LDARIFERVVRRDDRQLDVARHQLGRLAVTLGNEVADLVRRHFTADLTGQDPTDQTARSA